MPGRIYSVLEALPQHNLALDLDSLARVHVFTAQEEVANHVQEEERSRIVK